MRTSVSRIDEVFTSRIDLYYNLINLPLAIESDGLRAIAERRTAA